MQATIAIAVLALTPFEGHADPGNIPKVEFDQANLEEIVDFFRTAGTNGGQPRNIVLDPALDRDVTVTLSLRDVSLAEAFAYTAEIAGFDYRDEQHAVKLFPVRGGKPQGKAFLKRGAPATWRTASAIELPKVEYDSSTLGEVVSELAAASRQLDPRKKGLNIVLGHGVDPATPISFNLQNVPLSTVLKYVAEFARLNLRVDGPAVVFTTRAKAKKEE